MLRSCLDSPGCIGRATQGKHLGGPPFVNCPHRREPCPFVQLVRVEVAGHTKGCLLPERQRHWRRLELACSGRVHQLPDMVRLGPSVPSEVIRRCRREQPAHTREKPTKRRRRRRGLGPISLLLIRPLHRDALCVHGPVGSLDSVTARVLHQPQRVGRHAAR